MLAFLMRGNIYVYSYMSIHICSVYMHATYPAHMCLDDAHMCSYPLVEGDYIMAIILALIIMLVAACVIPAAVACAGVYSPVRAALVFTVPHEVVHTNNTEVVSTWCTTYFLMSAISNMAACDILRWNVKAARKAATMAHTRLVCGNRNKALYTARMQRTEAMAHVRAINSAAMVRADGRKALARANAARSATYAALNGSVGIKAAKRVALSTTRATVRMVTPVVQGSNEHVPVVVRTHLTGYISRPAANKAVSGVELGAAARAKTSSLVEKIQSAKAELAGLYDILPLARQVVGLRNKANRKVGMYSWLADEGHVGIRSTQSSVARRNRAQEVVCEAILAEEGFKAQFGIAADEVYAAIKAAKASKEMAISLLVSHKQEQHRLFLERQERRAAKAALKAKGGKAITSVVEEVRDWQQYVAIHTDNKAFAGLDVAIALVAA